VRGWRRGWWGEVVALSGGGEAVALSDGSDGAVRLWR
jgi:hypothetical protein